MIPHFKFDSTRFEGLTSFRNNFLFHNAGCINRFQSENLWAFAITSNSFRHKVPLGRHAEFGPLTDSLPKGKIFWSKSWTLDGNWKLMKRWKKHIPADIIISKKVHSIQRKNEMKWNKIRPEVGASRRKINRRNHLWRKHLYFISLLKCDNGCQN